MLRCSNSARILCGLPQLWNYITVNVLHISNTFETHETLTIIFLSCGSMMLADSIRPFLHNSVYCNCQHIVKTGWCK